MLKWLATLVPMIDIGRVGGRIEHDEESEIVL